MWITLIAIHGWELAALFAYLWWRDRRAVPVRRVVTPQPQPTPVNAPRPEEVDGVVQALQGHKKWEGKDRAALTQAAQEIAAKGREYLSRLTHPPAQ